MNDRLQALLEAERMAAAGHDDDAFADRVLGRLREVATLGVAAGIATSTPASASIAAPSAASTTATSTTMTSTTMTSTTMTATTATAAATLTSTIAGIGVVKVMVAGAVGSLMAASLVLWPGRPATTTTSSTAVPVRQIAVAAAPAVPVAVPVAAAVETHGLTSDDSAPVARVSARVRRARGAPPPHTPPSTSSPTELEQYDAASQALRAGHVDEAARLFAALLAAHPHGVLRPEAQMSLLECLYRAERFAAVVAAVPAALREIEGARVADVHRLEGDALVKLGRCPEARAAYGAALFGGSLNADDVSAALLACTPQ